MFDLSSDYPNVPVSTARRQFSWLVHSVAYKKSRFLLTSHKQPVVGIVPIDDVSTLDYVDQQKRAGVLEKAAKHQFFKNERRLSVEELNTAEKLHEGGRTIKTRGPDIDAVDDVLAELEASDNAPDRPSAPLCLSQLRDHLQEAMRLNNAIVVFLISSKGEAKDPLAFDQQVRNGLTLQEHLLSIQKCCSMLRA